MTPSHTPWTVITRPRPEAEILLYCFPFAGGAASAFHPWPDRFLETVEIRAVQYPGRETRWEEPPVADAGALADKITAGILPVLDGRPFVFFGHSLGALMAYEVTRRLVKKSGPQPEHLFLSARRAPPFEPSPPVLHLLDDEDFIIQMGTLNGTPPEVLQNRELMGLLLPMLRADFTLDETYRWAAGPPLHQNFSIFGAEADFKVPHAQLAAWSEFTRGASSLAIFPGGHFYFRDPGSGLYSALNRELVRLARGRLSR